jgi:alkanesulfonate monooxygenase SsuD/methylene tetrahydromethanopterin reductase-like flavin-dependent oxidoreductase (luciferase family)
MAFVAGATSRIRVNSCVIVLPYHDRSCWRRR